MTELIKNDKNNKQLISPGNPGVVHENLVRPQDGELHRI